LSLKRSGKDKKAKKTTLSVEKKQKVNIIVKVKANAKAKYYVVHVYCLSEIINLRKMQYGRRQGICPSFVWKQI